MEGKVERRNDRRDALRKYLFVKCIDTAIEKILRQKYRCKVAMFQGQRGSMWHENLQRVTLFNLSQCRESFVVLAMKHESSYHLN